MTAGNFHWSQIDLFLSDERMVPLDHTDSNYGSARRTLWDRVPEPKPRLHAVNTAETAASAAHQYETLIRRTLSEKAGTIPVFDLVLLGLGTDGHTASLFPGQPVLDEGTLLVAPTRKPQNGQERVTFTLPLLAVARQVVFLVAGAAKAGILEQAYQPEPKADLPATRVASQASDVVWLVDEEAARSLVKR
jgi:6-phosphogluconolactonase